MISILVSKFNVVYDDIKEKLSKIINPSMKIAIIPWAFATEINGDILEKEYFKVNGRRYNKYMIGLKELGIKDNMVYVCNCYKDTREKTIKIINDSDILIIPGGNPEMLYKKIVNDMNILDVIQKYKGIIIGESAGCELHLKKYFITKENNYYGCFSYYDGLDIIGNPFYIDVHTRDNKNYKKKLYEVANNNKTQVYAIYDNGAIFYNRKTQEINTYGKVELIKPKYIKENTTSKEFNNNINNKEISFRKLTNTRNDYEKLYNWCQNKHVYKYFEQRKLTYQEIENKYRQKLEEKIEKLYIIKYNDKDIGFVQIYKYKNDIKLKELKKYQNIYEYDLFIGDKNYINKGLGQKILNEINNLIYKTYNADCLVLRPFKDNIRACKCYEKSNFIKIYEYTDKDTLGNNKNIVFYVNKL